MRPYGAIGSFRQNLKNEETMAAIYHAILSRAHTASVNEVHALNAMTRKSKLSTRAIEPIDKL
jgi:hypothetical protein